jgi:hypothetical protein
MNMATKGDQEVVLERRVVASERQGGWLVAVLFVFGVLAAVAFAWWTVGTNPHTPPRFSQVPPEAASPDTSVQPRTTLPEGAL